MSRLQPVVVSALPLLSPRVDPRFVSSPRGLITSPRHAPRPARPVTSPRHGQGSSSNASVDVVQRKGNVVTYGPAGSKNRSGNRLPRIICYGDSNTAGFCNGGSHFEPYGKTLAARLAEQGMPCEVSVCGLCCLTTEDMLKNSTLESVRTPIGPHGRGLELMLDDDGEADLVIIMSGTNDLGAFTPIRTIVEDLRELHALCHERGIPTVAVAATQVSGPQPRKVRQQLADAVEKWARTSRHVLAFHDVEDLLPRPVTKSGTPGNPAAAVHWESDDLHISAAGSVQLGRRLAPHAANWLKKLQAGQIECPVVHRRGSKKASQSPVVHPRVPALQLHPRAALPARSPVTSHRETSPRTAKPVSARLLTRSDRSMSFEMPTDARKPSKAFLRSRTFS